MCENTFFIYKEQWYKIQQESDGRNCNRGSGYPFHVGYRRTSPGRKSVQDEGGEPRLNQLQD